MSNTPSSSMHSLLASILQLAKFSLCDWHFLSPKSPLCWAFWGPRKGCHLPQNERGRLKIRSTNFEIS